MTFSIRTAVPADGEACASIYRPFVLSSAISFEDDAPTAEQMAQRIATITQIYPWLVAVSDDHVVGYAYGMRFRERAAYRFTVETAIYISDDWQRQGVGRRLYTALLATLAEQGFTQAIASIALPHDSSITMHEAVGFQRTGIFREVGWKQGQWRDVGFWQKTLAITTDIAPAETKPFPQIGMILE